MWSASYARAVAESIGGLPTCAVGLVGRMEKFIVIIAGAFFEVFFPYRALTVALIAVGAVSVVTTIQRLVFARRELARRGDDPR